jgi:hypothetical protein
MFTWLRRGIAHRKRSILVDSLIEQIDRLKSGDWHADKALHGEVAIISGVMAVIAALVDAATAKMRRIGERHDATASEVIALELQIAQLPSKQHLVVPAPHQRQRRFLRRLPRLPRLPRLLKRRSSAPFVSKLHEPEVVPENGVYGDTVDTTTAIRQHDEFNDLIATDARAGEPRHHHHVARVWQRVTRVLLFFDVVALSTLTIKLLNVPVVDLSPWRSNPVGQLQLLVPALCFAVFAALVIAVAAHFVGEHTWRYIHRISPLVSDTKVHKRILIAAWAGLAVFSSLMGLAILVRLHADAAATSTPASVVWCVALLIGFAGVFAPLAVAMVDAWQPSPEVQRRSAMARIIAAVNHDEQALARLVCDRRTAMVELLQAGERLLADTKRKVDAERLPAHQAILILRARHGYAQEHATAIAYPEGDGFRVDADHGVQLAPLEEEVQRMRRGTVAPQAPALPAAADGLAAPPAGAARKLPMVTVASVIAGPPPGAVGRNGHPATTG